MYNAFWTRVTDVLSASFFGSFILKSFKVISDSFKESFLYSFFISKNMQRYGEKAAIPTAFRKMFFCSKLTDFISQSYFIRFFTDFSQRVLSCDASLLSTFAIPASLILFLLEFGNPLNMLVAALLIIFSFSFLLSKCTVADAFKNSFVIGKAIVLFDVETSEYKSPSKVIDYVIAFVIGIAVGAVSYWFGFQSAIVAFFSVLFLPIILASPLLILTLAFLLGIHFSSMPAFIFVVLADLAVFSRLVQKKLQLPKFRFSYVLVSLYSLVVLFFTFFGIAGSDSMLAGFIQFVFISIFFTTVTVVNTTALFKKFVNILTVVSLGPAFYGIFQFFTGAGGTGWSSESYVGGLLRIGSTFTNPNIFGEFLVIAVSLSIVSFLLSKTIKSKLFFALCIALQVVNLVITYSRGCYIACCLSALIIVWCCDKRLLGFGIFALPVLPKVLPKNMIARIMSVGAYLKDTSVLYRFSIWKGSLRIVKNHWYFATGIGTVAFTVLYQKFMISGAYAQHSHNTFIQLAVEVGLVGLFVFLLMHFVLLKDVCNVLSKSEKRARYFIIPTFASLAGLIVQGFFDYVFYNNIVFMCFWLVVALCVSSLNIIDDNKCFERKEVNGYEKI